MQTAIVSVCGPHGHEPLSVVAMPIVHVLTWPLTAALVLINRRAFAEIACQESPIEYLWRASGHISSMKQMLRLHYPYPQITSSGYGWCNDHSHLYLALVWQVHLHSLHLCLHQPVVQSCHLGYILLIPALL